VVLLVLALGINVQHAHHYIHWLGCLVELELAAAHPQLAYGHSMWLREVLICHSIEIKERNLLILIHQIILW